MQRKERLIVNTERELLKGNTPTLVLAVLKDQPLHGYGIAREIERRSDNALKFKEGTLYPALHALEGGRRGRREGAQNQRAIDYKGGPPPPRPPRPGARGPDHRLLERRGQR